MMPLCPKCPDEVEMNLDLYVEDGHVKIYDYECPVCGEVKSENEF